MSKNLNLEGTQHTQNQKNNMSDNDLRDGARNSKTLKGEGKGPLPYPEARDQGEIGEFGKQGSKQE